MKLTLGKVAASKLLILTSLISRGKISDVDLKNCIGCMDRILKWKAQTEKMKYLSTNTQIIYQNHYLKSQLLHSPINNMHNRLTNKDWQQKHRNRLYIYHIKRHWQLVQTQIINRTNMKVFNNTINMMKNSICRTIQSRIIKDSWAIIKAQNNLIMMKWIILFR